MKCYTFVFKIQNLILVTMETWRLCYMCSFLLGLYTGTQAEKRILIHAFLGRSRTSHFQIISKIAEGLTENGYFVDIALSRDNQNNLSPKDGDGTKDFIPNMEFIFYNPLGCAGRPTFSELNLATKTGGIFKTEKYSIAYPILKNIIDTCQCMIEDSDFIEDVTKKSYQLIIGGTLDPCHVVLAEILNVTNFVNINYASDEMLDHWLFPVQSWDASLSLRDKIGKVRECWDNYQFFETFFGWYSELAKEVTKRKISFYSLLNPTLWLLNSHPALDGNRLIGTNMVKIGGLTARAGKPLVRQDIDQFIRGAGGEGCIVFSVNTVSKSVNSDIANKFSAAFGRLPIRVVWKQVSTSVPDNLSDNIMVISWMEENDINDVLAYDNIKAFLTTGGRTGLFEAIYHGVPVICFPLFRLEHFTNCDKIVRKGFGKILDMRDSSEDDVYEAIMDVISNKSYGMSATRWSRVFHSFPASPDIAISRMINVIENGADTLSVENQQILLPISLLTDIIFLFFLGVLVVFMILGFLYKLFSKFYVTKKLKSA